MLYLSEEWFRQANIILENVESNTQSDLIKVGFLITYPNRDLRYTLLVDKQGFSYQTVNHLDNCPIVFKMDIACAETIAIGKLNPQDALLSNRLEIAGDITTLTEVSETLSNLEDYLQPLREKTEYSTI